MTNLNPSRVTRVWKQLRSEFPLLLVTLGVGALLAFFRYFTLGQPIVFVLPAFIFVLGVGLAHLLFLYEAFIQIAVDNFLKQLDKMDEQIAIRQGEVPQQPTMQEVPAAPLQTFTAGGIPVMPVGSTPEMTAVYAAPSAAAPVQPFAMASDEIPRSILRQAHFLLLLPIVDLVVVSSSRSALGNGFLWGLNIVYFLDLWPMWMGQRESVLARYFGAFDETPPWAFGLAVAFQVCVAALTIVMILI